MTAGCTHDNVVLPDELPDPIRTALALPVDRDGGRPVSRIIDTVLAAVCMADLVRRGRNGMFRWDTAAACAVLRRHPDVAQVYADKSEMLCARAATVTDLAATLPDRTDLGLAERVALLCGADLAWSEDDRFRVWTPDGLWRNDPTGARALEHVKWVVRTLLPVEARNLRRIADAARRNDPKAADPATKDAIRAADAAAKFATRSQGAGAMRAALDLLRAEPAVLVPVEAWDADERLLCCADVTVELTDAGPKAREHRRDDHLTHQTRARYRPRASRAEFDRFLTAALPDPQVRAFLQRLLGYALLGHNARRILLLLVGPTSSGKSTLLEALIHALGAHGSSFKLSLFRSESEPGRARPDLIAAMPRRLLITTETSDRWQLDADAVKRLTGNDSDASRGLFANAYAERRPAFLPIIATNSAPKIRGADKALWRRLLAVPFDVTVAQEAEDATLGERLRDEADGVLAWLVQGYAEYVRAGGFGPVPQACSDAARAVRADMTLVDRWLADHTEAGPDFSERNSELAEDWHRWCVVHRVAPADQLSHIALGAELAARGYGVGYGGPSKRRHRVRTGVRLRPDREHGHDVHAAGCTCTGCVGPVRQRWARP